MKVRPSTYYSLSLLLYPPTSFAPSFRTSGLVTGFSVIRSSGALSGQQFARNTSLCRRFSAKMVNPTSLPTVSEFLHESLQQYRANLTSQLQAQDDVVGNHPPCRLSLGNPAGDADSIISAMGIAYHDTYLQETLNMPLLSIPLQDLQSLRPETKYLLQLGGVHVDTCNDSGNGYRMLSIDNVTELPILASLALVDHNKLVANPDPSKFQWTVHAIFDHHVDEGAHADTCPTEQRQVAFDNDSNQALVASTCTLVVETWRASSTVAMPPTLAILLFGVILLDSINLSPSAGKVTTRDEAAVEWLLKSTDWKALSLPFDILEDQPSSFRPDKTKLFDKLQNQKFEASFWNGLTAAQGLQLDYKSFAADETNHQRFGLSSVMQSMEDFCQKPNLYETIAETYLKECQFFGILFTRIVNDIPHRQLLLAGQDANQLQSLKEYLNDQDVQLQVKEEFCHASTQVHVLLLDQGNSKASRKQVAPIMMDFLKGLQ